MRPALCQELQPDAWNLGDGEFPGRIREDEIIERSTHYDRSHQPLSSQHNADDTMCVHQTCDLDSLPCGTREHLMPIIVEAEIHR
jgi:hypothetical protein